MVAHCLLRPSRQSGGAVASKVADQRLVSPESGFVIQVPDHADLPEWGGQLAGLHLVSLARTGITTDCRTPTASLCMHSGPPSHWWGMGAAAQSRLVM